MSLSKLTTCTDTIFGSDSERFTSEATVFFRVTVFLCFLTVEDRVFEVPIDDPTNATENIPSKLQYFIVCQTQ